MGSKKIATRKRKRARSAVTGRFVSAAYARRYPRLTVTESF